MIKLPYKELKIWKKGLELTRLIYEATFKFPIEEKYGLTSQIRRSAVSIPSNIAEGSQRKTDKEFSKFIAIAKGSLAELETQLIIFKMLKYFKTNEYENLMIRINELNKMLIAFYKKLTANH